MKIAIISTRGIPNNYGGFEQFAEYISVGLVNLGHEVTVYSPHFHSYKEKSFKGVNIKHIYSPEEWMGSSIGSFFYDFFSFKDALKKQQFDIIYEAGYTSIIPAYLFFNIKKRKSPIIVTNMDGLEHQRSKFNKWAQKFILWEEKTTTKYSHYLIADNKGIQEYYKKRYRKESELLFYGANIYDDYCENYLEEFKLQSNNYYLVIARLEPENNIETIIQGFLHSNKKDEKPLIILGKTDTPFGKYLVEKYKEINSIRFLGGIYDFNKINSIRYFSSVYFHGHSVGGTNPSLLEAMASSCFIVAHDNIFNKSVLEEDALFFSSSSDVSTILSNIDDVIKENETSFIEKNLTKIKAIYSWDKIIKAHEKYFLSLIK